MPPHFKLPSSKETCYMHTSYVIYQCTRGLTGDNHSKLDCRHTKYLQFNPGFNSSSPEGTGGEIPRLQFRSSKIWDFGLSNYGRNSDREEMYQGTKKKKPTHPADTPPMRALLCCCCSFSWAACAAASFRRLGRYSNKVLPIMPTTCASVLNSSSRTVSSISSARLSSTLTCWTEELAETTLESRSLYPQWG